MPQSKKRSATRTTSKKRPTISKLFRRRWLELSGLKFGPKFRVPLSLVLSLETLAPAQAGGVVPKAAPEIVVFTRKLRGSGCGKMAEIAGWYSAPVGPGGCIGQAAVLAALNAAAGKKCCNVLQCPKVCPCHYTPQHALAAYTCTATLEEGFLLQNKEIWNCRCLVEVRP